MSGSSTRDWLLDKLLKMRVSLTEMKAELTASEERRVREVGEAQRSLASYREAYRELETRVKDLSPEKQFSVVYRDAGGNKLPMGILSVRSCNGTTTITVERG